MPGRSRSDWNFISTQKPKLLPAQEWNEPWHRNPAVGRARKADGHSRQELSAKAKSRKVKGRSKMSKRQWKTHSECDETCKPVVAVRQEFSNDHFLFLAEMIDSGLVETEVRFDQQLRCQRQPLVQRNVLEFG